MITDSILIAQTALMSKRVAKMFFNIILVAKLDQHQWFVPVKQNTVCLRHNQVKVVGCKISENDVPPV